MATKNCSAKSLNFGIDTILSNEASHINYEKSRISIFSDCLVSYPYFESYGSHVFFKNFSNPPYFQDPKSRLIGPLLNNCENIFGSINNIIRPSPIRPKPEDNVMISATDITDNSHSRRRSWSRAVFSSLQRKSLEKRFAIQKYIAKPDRRQLATLLGLTDAQVKVWFQNRRMKWRHTKKSEKVIETQVNLTYKTTMQPMLSDTLENSPEAKSFEDENIDVESDL